MARPRKIAQVVETPVVVGDNIQKDVPVVSTGDDMITIACRLPLGIAFDDVPNGTGGFKTIIFPSVNECAKHGGVLVDAGKAVAIQIAKKDWENILHNHGREIAFTGRDGYPPCIVPMKDMNEFRSRQTEIIADMAHGLEPLKAEEITIGA